MKTIKLNASSWQTPLDFFEAILPALGAPDWHGNSVNALVESMVWGSINKVEPPYTVEIYSTKGLSCDVAQEIRWTEEGLAKQKKEYNLQKGHDVDVRLKLID